MYLLTGLHKNKMHPKIPFWENKINHVTSECKSAFGKLNFEELNWKPSSKVWSIGQIIHHLITINKTYFPIIEQLKSGTYKKPFMASFPFMVNFFGNFILKSVDPDQKRKTKTFPIWEPAQSVIPADILVHFEQHQKELVELIKSCDVLLQKNSIISSPANPNIIYTLEKAFDIITTHEQRHFNQAKEMNALRLNTVK